jgi:hypothetical protein
MFLRCIYARITRIDVSTLRLVILYALLLSVLAMCCWECLYYEYVLTQHFSKRLLYLMFVVII